MVKDIFAAVYTDLGDIQTNEIREVIKQSYAELGYALPDAPPNCRYRHSSGSTKYLGRGRKSTVLKLSA